MSVLENLVKPLALKLELNTLPQHIHHVLGAYFLYEFIFKVASPAISSALVPKYKTFDTRTRVNWDIHVVSMVQCLIISTLAVNVILTDPTREKAAETDYWRDRLWGYSEATGTVQGFAAGYFLWDVVACTTNIDSQGIAGLLHGLAALTISGLGFRPFGNYYGINFTLFELSTPFLNIHWFCDKLGMTGSTLQLVNGVVFIISFFLSRLVWGTWQTYRMYSDVWNAWNNTGHLSKVCKPFFNATNKIVGGSAWVNIPWRCRILPTWLGATYVGGLGLLTILNYWWFTQIISAVTKRFRVASKKSSAVEKKAQ
jgi:hypothetical protein